MFLLLDKFVHYFIPSFFTGCCFHFISFCSVTSYKQSHEAFMMINQSNGWSKQSFATFAAKYI